MQADNEVIDVEEFHDNLQRNSLEELKKKNHKLTVENKKLDTKIYHLNRANDSLSHKLFEQEQRRYEFARRLGFDNLESAEECITFEDPWVPGGRTALSEAHARILLLENEIAKHITTSKEAQSVVTETYDQLEETRLRLDEALEDVMRLREERDLAREEAEKQAMDAHAWRIEVQKTLPEMQTLIIKQQQDSKALYVSQLTASNEKENLSSGRFEHTHSHLRDIANTISLTEAQSSPSFVPALEAQRYKQQFELLEARYMVLLETKERISKQFCEQLVKWKKFKRWLVKEEAQSGHRLGMRRRNSRKRKAIEDIEPQLFPQGVELDETSTPAVQNNDAAAIPQDILAQPLSDGYMSHVKGTTDQLNCHSTTPPLCSPMKFGTRDLLSLNTPRCQQNLTQPSGVSTVQRPTKTVVSQAPYLSTTQRDPFVVSNDIPLSQQSLTQPSSLASLSPVQAPENMLHAAPHDLVRPMVLAIDSPPREMRLIKRNKLSVETPQHIAASQSPMSLTSAAETPVRIKTSEEGQLQCQRLMTAQPVSEPPPLNRLRHLSQPRGQAIERTSTVLVMDTPHRTSTRALKRHYSSPLYSQHLNKGKRKAPELEESGATQTRDEKLARLKVLTKQPHKAYMAEYMQFKGRGRYSSAKGGASKTINGEFEIDKDRNGGLGFQYDTLVRDKDERRRLEAGDCECCRDYYEAVGPLPPRLQAPLWKSPSSGSDYHTARPCRYETNRNRNNTPTSSPSTHMHAKTVDAHKHSISRHRYNWAPPNTPPDFWEIEFPDTPTVHDINRRADQMHAHKFGRVEAEANSMKGRYRKRK